MVSARSAALVAWRVSEAGPCSRPVALTLGRCSETCSGAGRVAASDPAVHCTGSDTVVEGSVVVADHTSMADNSQRVDRIVDTFQVAVASHL